ncbi:hypothetical protein [Actinoplanes sp. NPDC026670]|uniref:hypothetical protein n=1 Tax=Actinoplanes sp. NPDC026670 TaxID=3154700 RepID=UPI0033F5B157
MSQHEVDLQLGDRDAINRERLVLESFARDSPEPFVRWTTSQTQSMHLFMDGDLDGAESVAQDGFELGVASGQPEAFYGYAGQIFQIRRAQDRLAETAGAIEEVLQANPALQVFHAALAYVRCELGRETEARALIGAFDISACGAPQFWSTALMLWAEVCHTLDLPEHASRLVPVLSRWQDQVASTGASTEGAIAHGLGRALATLGRTQEAAAAYELALTVNRRLRAPLFVARTHLAYAQALSGAEPGRARAMAAEAEKTAQRFGFAMVQRHVTRLLEQLP